MVDRSHREQPGKDIARLAGAYHAWRGNGKAGLSDAVAVGAGLPRPYGTRRRSRMARISTSQ